MCEMYRISFDVSKDRPRETIRCAWIKDTHGSLQLIKADRIKTAQRYIPLYRCCVCSKLTDGCDKDIATGEVAKLDRAYYCSCGCEMRPVSKSDMLPLINLAKAPGI